jgi:hypothetical protein
VIQLLIRRGASVILSDPLCFAVELKRRRVIPLLMNSDFEISSECLRLLESYVAPDAEPVADWLLRVAKCLLLLKFVSIVTQTSLPQVLNGILPQCLARISGCASVQTRRIAFSDDMNCNLEIWMKFENIELSRRFAAFFSQSNGLIISQREWNAEDGIAYFCLDSSVLYDAAAIRRDIHELCVPIPVRSWYQFW